jgi:LmbE family N-acetylglucosaminyl deacetylase
MEPTPLEPVSEDWERALVVVAHPDDVEFGAAAAIARWTDQGKTVVYCMVTSGEAGIDGLTPDESREVRIGEQIASGKIVGVEEVEFLGLPDGILEYGVPLRRAITEGVRRHRPEIIITNNFRETWGGTMPNQPDHMAVGRAALNTAGDAGNRWIFPEQLVDGLEPWGGVKQVWAAGSPDGKHGVDTTDTFDRGVESLKAHKAYIDGLGWEHFDPAEFLEGMSRPTGSRLGVTHAASFEVFSMTWGD